MYMQQYTMITMLVLLPSKSLRELPQSIQRIEVWRLSIALDRLTVMTEGKTIM